MAAARRGRRTRAEAEATRTALVAAGRDLFATTGYDDTSVEDVADRAGLTKGAFYHHFRDKAALLDTVYAEVERDFNVRVLERIGSIDDPIEALRAASDVYLDDCLDPLFRTLMVTVPAALGWRRFRGLDTDLQLGGMQALLDEGVTRGLLAQTDTEMLSHLLLGALQEAAFVIADAPGATGARRARRAAGATFHAMLDALTT
jgi:AcrR family transcriptional regulator